MIKIPTFTSRQIVITTLILLTLSSLSLSAYWQGDQEKQSSLEVTATSTTEDNYQAAIHATTTEEAPLSFEVTSTTTTTDIQPARATETKIPPKTQMQTEKIEQVTKEPEALTTTPAETTTYTEPTVSSNRILQEHNAIRGKKGLTPLTWSSTLAAGAQAWSEVLKGEGCSMRHNYTSGYGENIYWANQTGGDVNKMISTDKDPVTWWASEEKFYDYERNTCRPGEQCGHYTQIVWSDTTQVGCGVSSCQEGKARTDIWVCRYNPQGNIIGERPY